MSFKVPGGYLAATIAASDAGFSPIVGSPPVNVTAPVLSGTFGAGETITITPGTWTDADSVSWTMYNGDGLIGDQASTTYVMTQADEDSGSLYMIATGSNIYGDTNVNSNTISEFQLPSDQFVSAKMPMHALYPRPDTETNADARHLWAHSGFEYRVPIGVQGGAWPFKYEIISAPIGATIGQYWWAADYGVLKIGGGLFGASESITVRVTDQDGSTVDLSWTVTLDNTKFVFIEDGWTGTKTGTIDEPLEDISDWYLNSNTDATYAGRIVVLRGGAYTLTGDGGNLNFDPDDKTRGFVGYPDETPVIDCSTAAIVITTGGTADDLFVGGISWTPANDNDSNPHFFFLGSGDRTTFWGNSFSDMTHGTDGSDNTCAVFWNSQATVRQNIFVKSNDFNNINNSTGSNGSYIDIYTSEYILIESNTARNSTTNYGFWMKYSEDYTTVRDNVAVDNVEGVQILIGGSSNIGNTVEYTEVCWNRIQRNSTNLDCFTWSGGGTTHTEDFFYRNTVVGKPAFLHPGTQNYIEEDNLYITDDTTFLYQSYVTNINDLVYGSAVGAVDSEGKLTGTYRTAHLGLNGSELQTARGY